MNGIDVTKVTMSWHFKQQFAAKGFTAEQLFEALSSPYKVTEVRRYPGQLRYCGGGVAVIMDGMHAITIYADGIVTPLRPDQRDDPEALASRRLMR